MKRSSSLATALSQPAGVNVVSENTGKWPQVPREIGKLHDLEVLILNGADVVDLPQELWSLPRLRVLNLWQNHLHNLASDIGQLSTLEDLILGANPLSTIPDQLNQLTKLRKLNLANCKQILWEQAFPVICSIESLEHLSLYQNCITHIPPQISKLRRLHTLRLFGCQLKELPWELTELRELRKLDVRANQIHYSPPLPWLEHFDISYNPISI